MSKLTHHEKRRLRKLRGKLLEGLVGLIVVLLFTWVFLYALLEMFMQG